jgi:hypothetical protein
VRIGIADDPKCSVDMKPFRFGVSSRYARSRIEFVEEARKIEGLGYDTLTLPDDLTDRIAPMPALFRDIDRVHVATTKITPATVIVTPTTSEALIRADRNNIAVNASVTNGYVATSGDTRSTGPRASAA